MTTRKQERREALCAKADLSGLNLINLSQLKLTCFLLFTSSNLKLVPLALQNVQYQTLAPKSP